MHDLGCGACGSFARLTALASLAFIFSTACATNAKYERALQSWMGADVNRLIEAWGPPSNEYKMPNGDVMYTWLRVGGTVVTVGYNRYLNLVTAGAVTYWCKTTFAASPSGTVQSWRWEGNACKSR